MTTNYDGIAKEYLGIEAAELLTMCEAIARNLKPSFRGPGRTKAAKERSMAAVGISPRSPREKRQRNGICPGLSIS